MTPAFPAGTVLILYRNDDGSWYATRHLNGERKNVTAPSLDEAIAELGQVDAQAPPPRTSPA